MDQRRRGQGTWASWMGALLVAGLAAGCGDDDGQAGGDLPGAVFQDSLASAGAPPSPAQPAAPGPGDTGVPAPPPSPAGDGDGDAAPPPGDGDGTLPMGDGDGDAVPPPGDGDGDGDGDGMPGDGDGDGVPGDGDGDGDGDGVDPSTLDPFSFFVTSLEVMRELSGSNDGFGGDLGGLEGADSICQQAADRVGFGAKTWRAFLSATDDGSGSPVHAIDRIGDGPWYDANGRLNRGGPGGLARGGSTRR